MVPYAASDETRPAEDAVVGLLVAVRSVVSATATGIMVGTPLGSTGAGVSAGVGAGTGAGDGAEVGVAGKTPPGGLTDAKAKPE